MSNSAAHLRTHFTHFKGSPRKLRKGKFEDPEYGWYRLSEGRIVRMKRVDAEAKGLGGKEVIE